MLRLAVGVEPEIVVIHVDVAHIVTTVELIGDIFMHISQQVFGFIHSEEDVDSLHWPRGTKASDLVDVDSFELCKLAMTRASNLGLLLGEEAIQKDSIPSDKGEFGVR